MSFAFDVNILLYASDTNSPYHKLRNQLPVTCDQYQVKSSVSCHETAIITDYLITGYRESVSRHSSLDTPHSPLHNP